MIRDNISKSWIFLSQNDLKEFEIILIIKKNNGNYFERLKMILL